jgi:hypothetical protein
LGDGAVVGVWVWEVMDGRGGCEECVCVCVCVCVFVGLGWMGVGAAAAEMGEMCGVATSESVSRIERHGRRGFLALGRCLGRWCCLLIYRVSGVFGKEEKVLFVLRL